MTLPQGFQYAAAYAGIRKDTRDDIAIISSDHVAKAAAVFTTNVVQASPVRLARHHLRSSGGKVKAVLVNAGNANCATRTGDEVAVTSCKAVAKALNTKSKYVVPASTGVIGVELDPKLLKGAIPGLAAGLSPENFTSVAKAILTTDTRLKVASEELEFRRGTVRIAGITKGSGMIHPNMATTLGFVMTDADLPARTLRGILTTATARSYNSLAVDGDMSTNDMVILLANGASKVSPKGKKLAQFAEAVTRVMESLAEQIAADGEGARKLITITTSGFKDESEARKVGRAIANSPLVKTAMAGSDPNWGRILAAAGYSGVSFDPTKVSITVQGVLVCHNGLAVEIDESALKEKLNGDRVAVELKIEKGGHGQSRFFTCDLTEGYIQINGSYRT